MLGSNGLGPTSFTVSRRISAAVFGGGVCLGGPLCGTGEGSSFLRISGPFEANEVFSFSSGRALKADLLDKRVLLFGEGVEVEELPASKLRQRFFVLPRLRGGSLQGRRCGGWEEAHNLDG